MSGSGSRPVYRITLEVRVTDANRLRRAAEKRAVREGLTPEAWARLRKDTGTDLIMMLDPPEHWAGCEIIESRADLKPL